MWSIRFHWTGFAATALFLLFHNTANAQACYETTINSPVPFMGNNDEIFQVADGSIWQVKYEYEYLYEYYPNVILCPARSVLIINGKSLNVTAIRATHSSPSARPPAASITVIYRVRGCDYFVGDGPSGLYVLQWYGGYDPVVGDVFVGYTRGYGSKTVTYLHNGREGRLWAEDYLLSTSRAADIISDKCS